MDHDTEQQPSGGAALVLASGRRVDIDPEDRDRVNITSPDGTFEVAVLFGPTGPTLRVSATSLELRTTGALALDCESLAIRARGAVGIHAGSLTEEIEGARTSVVGGRSTHEAHAVGIRARLGDVALDANDNVRATGEKILLNS